MASFEVNKLQQSSQVSTPTTKTTDAGSSAVSNKPIDFSNKDIANNSEITAYISSEEFKNLKPEEQIQQLKSKFFPSADNATVQQYLSVAKQAIAASNTTETATTPSTTSETETPATTGATETPATTTGSTKSSATTSPLENDINTYIEKNNFKGDIDDLKSQLLLKQKSSQSLTPEEQKILDQLQQYDKTCEKIESTLEKVGFKNMGKFVGRAFSAGVKQRHASNIQEFDEQNLVSMKTLLSEEFRQKVPSEKLNILTDAYLEKNYPEYKNLSAEEKKEICEKQMDRIIDILDPDSSKSSLKEQNKVVMDAASLLQYAHTYGLSIEELKQMSPEQLKTELEIAKQEQLNDIIKLIPQDELKGKTPDQKIMMYADLILSSTDDEYNKLEGNEKRAYLANKTDDFIENELGLTGWKNLQPKEKEHLFQNASGIMCMLAEEGISYNDYQKFTEAQKTSKQIKYYEKNGYNIPPTLKAKNKVIQELQKEHYGQPGIKEPTEKDVYEYLRKREALGNLSKQEAHLLKEMRTLNQIGVKPGNKKADCTSNQLNAATIGFGTPKAYIEHKLKEITPENIDSNKQSISALINGAINDRDMEQVKLIKETLIKNGFTMEQIDKMIPPESYAEFAAQGLVDNNGNKAGEATVELERLGNRSGDKTLSASVKRIARDTTEIATQYLEKKELTDFGKHVVQEGELVPAYTRGLNNRQYISKEDAAEVSLDLVNSNNVSNASKAMFTQNMIENSRVNGPDEQLYFGKEFSQVDNAAVLEGLAAASNSVDSSVQNQYNSYIDSAVKRFPPEQQSTLQQTIQAARETGTISQVTLSQQTPEVPLQADSKSNTTNNNQSTNSNVNNNTASSAKNTQSQQNTRTVTSSTPAAPKAPVSSNNTPKTQTTVDVSTTNTSRALRQKVDTLADRIIEYETKKADNNIKREQERNQAQAASSEDAKTSSAQSSTNVSKTAEQAQTTNKNEPVLNQADEHILKEIFNTGGITALYDALVQKTGNNHQEVFFEKLVQFAKPSDVISFANSYKHNKDVLLNLINYCPNKELKFDILNMLPSQTINELISSQKINSVDFEKLVRNGKVDSKTIIEFLKKNKSGMSADELKKYSAFLSLADRNILAGLITEKMGTEKGSDEWLRLQQQNMKTTTSNSPQTAYADSSDIPTFEDALAIGSTKLPMRDYDKMKKTGHTYIG